MRALPILRSLLLAGLLGSATGCFVFDEIDNAGKPPGSENKAATAPAAAKSGDGAAAAAGKPGAGAANGAQPAAPSEKGWWQTARTLGSEDSNTEITRCDLAGRSEFMLRDDCVARGGHPK